MVSGPKEGRLRLLPRGVELDQLAGHLTRLLAHLARGALPLVAADLVDLRRRAVRAGVALNPVDLVCRDEEPVAALILHHDIIAQIIAFAFALDQSAVDSDAVMDMDDEIVLAQIEHGGDRHAACDAPAAHDRPGAAEQLGVRDHVEADIGDLEAGAQPALGHIQAGAVARLLLARPDRQVQLGADLPDAGGLVGDQQHAAVVRKPRADLIRQPAKPPR